MAIPTGPWLLANYSELPSIYRVYISYRTLASVIIFFKMIRHFLKKDEGTEHNNIEALEELNLKSEKLDLVQNL